MQYKIEELVPIVGELAEAYTSHESSSITYEKAEQLMGAVLYCIHEWEMSEKDFAVSAEHVSARQAYQAGVMHVEKKVKKSLALYNELSSKFLYYENRCLYDTFVKGMPEFFKWYDIRFEPQNTILTLDYPVLKNLSRYTGIDKIYEYLKCIFREQKFLSSFPENYVVNILSEYSSNHRDMIENLCEIVLMSVSGHISEEKRVHILAYLDGSEEADINF